MELNRVYATENEKQLSEVFSQIQRRMLWILDEELGEYMYIYFANYDIFLRMLACLFYDSECEFICYEDGFSTYIIDYLRKDRAAINRHPEGGKIRNKVKKVLLYEPRLAMRGDGLTNLSLPKIKPDDQQTKEVLNHVFDYHRPKEHAEFLFLEQSFREEGIQTNDIELMRECQTCVGTGRFFVKPHPRNRENVPLTLGLTRKYTCDVPWELFLLNEYSRERFTVLTVCSNAALTSRIVFGMDLNTVMLYPLFHGKILWKEDEILLQYLKRFRIQFAGKNYYVPQTIYELRRILGYLGGHNG